MAEHGSADVGGEVAEAGFGDEGVDEAGSDVSPGSKEGIQLAYEIALRHGDDACVVICRIPASTYDNLVRQGHVVVEPIPGVPIPQTVFRPGAFPIINRTATWVGPIKPGG